MRFFILPFIVLLSLTAPVAARDNVPDSKLTPGEILTTDIALVCKHGFSAEIRKTTQSMKDKTYHAYKVRGSRKHWKIDHLVPLSLGGADTMKNIWPSNFRAKKYNASAKDRLELKIREMVCDGTISVKEGQKLFMDDWRQAYDKYCMTWRECPSYVAKKRMSKR